MKKARYLLFFMLAALIVLAGCFHHGASPAKKSEPAPHHPVKPVLTYPLTGLPARGEQNQRVIGVMINNHALARPQSGLYKADIVYEVLAEGNITRFLALYQSEKPDEIGPIRSARPYFIDLNNGYGALYICHGWSTAAKTMLETGKTDYINGLFYDGTLFHRVAFRKAPHNSYITYDNIIKGAKQKHFALTEKIKSLHFLTKQQVDKLTGKTVHEAVIRSYGQGYTVGYVYNKKSGVFKRYSNGELSADRETKKPVTAANVFIVSTRHHLIAGDTKGRRDIDLTSGGDAYLLQHGKLNKVKWKNVGGRILPYKNGKLVKFVPGKTWINIIPDVPGLSGVTITS